MEWRNPKEMTKKTFVQPPSDSLTPIRGISHRRCGPFGAFVQPLCKYELMLEAIPSTSLWRASTLAQPM